MINVKNYVQSASTLDRMIFDETLEGRLKALILAVQTEGRASTTVDFYVYTIGSFLIFCEGQKLINPRDVTTDHLRLFIRKLQLEHSPGGVLDYYRGVKRFFNWLVEEKRISFQDNPMAPIGPPKHPKVIIKPYSEDDIHRMLTVCNQETFHGARDAAIVWVYIDTGLRASEMIGIKLQDVNVKSRTIIVTGKGNKQRVVKYGQRANLAILQYHKVRQAAGIGGEPLFVNRDGRALTRSGLLQLVERLCRRAEISGAKHNNHTFRHFFGTMALLNGAQMWQVQEIMGHETLSTTQKYQKTINSWNALTGHEKFSPGDRLRI